MQASAAAIERPPDRHLVRPAGVLAEMLADSELGEDELLLKLREAGLIAYPLLGGLLEYLPEVLAAEVLSRLEPTDVVMFGQVGRSCRAAVVAFGVPQEPETSDDEGDDEEGGTGEGTEGGPLLLRVENFVGSAERLAWAKERGCPWDGDICKFAAWGGHLEVLKWAREHRCPWDFRVCACAARGGHLEMLKRVREHGCDWTEGTSSTAAAGGHLEVLRWAHEHGCPWGASTCSFAALNGHLHVLQWARENGCPWNQETLTDSATR